MSYITRSEELLEQICTIDFRTETDIDKLKTLLRRALRKEGDLTKHACANSVLKCSIHHSNLVLVDDATVACVNIKSEEVV